MRRAPETAAVALLLIALAAWTVAFVTAKPPAAPSLVVTGEPLLPKGTPIALRITAARANAEKRSSVAGTVRLGGVKAPVVDGTVRLPADAVRAAGAGEVEPALDLVVDGAVDVHARVEQRPTSLRLGPAKLMYQSWLSEILMVAKPAPGHEPSKDPIYPVDGMASGRLKTRALVLGDGNKPTSIDLDPAMAGARLDDGRVLRVDRSGIRLEAPFEADANGTIKVVVETAEKRDIGVDLLVDGVVHDAKNLTVDKRAEVELRLGDARPGDVVVVHAGGVWPDELGRSVVARVRDPGTPFVTWLADVARRAGAPADDPLLAWLKAHPDDQDATRAMLNRLRPAKLRGSKLPVTLSAASDVGRGWFLAYSALALLCVLLVAVLGVVRLPERRLMALVGALALGLILAGLDAVLVVMAHS